MTQPVKKYTEDHEWLCIEDNSSEGIIATVGITEYAATQLGDLVYIELPEVGQHVTKGDEVVVIESVKAAGEVLAPCDGHIVEINQKAADDPEMVAANTEGNGWLFKIAMSDISQTNDMMDEAAYTNKLS